MNKLCVVLTIIGLVGFMFAFTGCDKPKAETEKAIAVAQAVYAQDSEQAVKAEKKADKAVIQKKAKAEQAKPEQKKAKSKKGKAQQKQTKAKAVDSKQANKIEAAAGTAEKKAEAAPKK